VCVCVSHFLLLEKRVTRQLIVVVRFLMKHERLPKHRRLAFFQFLPFILLNWFDFLNFLVSHLFVFRLAWNLLSWTNIYSPQKFSRWKTKFILFVYSFSPFSAHLQLWHNAGWRKLLFWKRRDSCGRKQSREDQFSERKSQRLVTSFPRFNFFFPKFLF
jgi:hypothetical protein